MLGQPSAVVVQFAGTPQASPPIRVYVTGAVKSPGVYPLNADARIIDAVTAAGGLTAAADSQTIPMAQAVKDGQTVHIPPAGQPFVTTDAAAAASPLVDLNHASINLLRTLPGIGATRAQNIIASRQTMGPFTTPNDLVTRKLVTAAIFSQIKGLVQVTP